MVVAFLGLGSNLGDREAHLKRSIQSLAGYRVHPVKCSSIFETEPRDVENQPWFLNAVVEVTTSLTPRELLDACLQIEQQHHRVRAEVKIARTLDLDILFYGDGIVEEPGLKIPHPRLHERRFVLAPLCEIAPDFVDPVSRKRIVQLLAESPDRAEVRRFGPPPP